MLQPRGTHRDDDARCFWSIKQVSVLLRHGRENEIYKCHQAILEAEHERLREGIRQDYGKQLTCYGVYPDLCTGSVMLHCDDISAKQLASGCSTSAFDMTDGRVCT